MSVVHAIPPSIARPPGGGGLNIKMSSYQWKILMLKKRRSRDRLIFDMEIPYLEIRYLYSDVAQRALHWQCKMARFCRAHTKSNVPASYHKFETM